MSINGHRAYTDVCHRFRPQWWAVGIGLLAVLGIAHPVVAVMPDWSLHEYVQTTWTHRDGKALVEPGLITQTNDGYLWFLSAAKLVRFDGVRFVDIPAPCDRIQHLKRDNRGALWLLCREGIAKYRLLRRHPTGQFDEVSLSGLSFAGATRPAVLFLDSRGRAWVCTNVIARLEPDGTMRELGRMTGEGIRSVTEDSDGTVWLTNGNTIIRSREDRLDYLAMPLPVAVYRSSSGGILVSDSEKIQHFVGTTRTLVARAPQGVVLLNFGASVATDSTGTIWAATRQHGVARVQGGTVETLALPGELGSATSDVFVDREDTVWVTSTTGLHRFRKPYARMLSSVGVAMPPRPQLFFIDSRDDLWTAGDPGALLRVDAATKASKVFPGVVPLAISEDHDGHIWVATRTGILRLAQGIFEPVPDVAGAPVKNVWTFAKDGAGTLWALAQRSGVYQVSPGPPRRVSDEPIAGRNLLLSSRHGIWVTLADGHVRQSLAGRAAVIRAVSTRLRQPDSAFTVATPAS